MDDLAARVHAVAVDEDHVHAPVAVVVEHDRAAAVGLEDPVLVDDFARVPG